MKCFDYEINKNTAGQPVMGRKCYCKTTACMHNNTIGSFNFGIYYERDIDEQEIDEQEMERRFYEKVFKTKLL